MNNDSKISYFFSCHDRSHFIITLKNVKTILHRLAIPKQAALAGWPRCAHPCFIARAPVKGHRVNTKEHLRGDGEVHARVESGIGCVARSDPRRAGPGGRSSAGEGHTWA